MNTFQTNLRNICPTAIPEYSLKVRYITVVDPNGARFLISNTVFLLQDGNTVLCLKIHHKYERHLRLVAHIVTKLSQNVYLVKIHILIY